MTIDDYTKIFQIFFYTIMACIAVLTYIKAKNTLLNSVNTEYHKHVIDALIKLSNELFSEFEEESDNYWIRGNRVKEIVEEINQDFLANKDAIFKSGRFLGGVRVSDLEKRLMSQISRYKSDPFLPDEIRLKVVDLLQNRFDVHHQITFAEYTDYREALAQAKYNNTLDENYGWISNNINRQLYERGCGVSQIEDAVHELRLDIKKYLERFNPLGMDN